MNGDMNTETVPRREQDGDIVVDAIVEAEAFKDYVGVLRGLVSEARIHFNNEGLRTTAADPGNIAMIDATLSTDAFESYDAGAVTIGVNLNRLAEELDFANAGDLIRVRIDMETRKLRLDIGDHIKPTIALIDPDSIRKDPDIPDDLELVNTAVVTPAQLKTGIKAVDHVTDHIRFAFDDEAEAFVIHGEGDVDETRVEYDMDALKPGSDFGESIASLFSLGYVQDVHGAIPSTTETVEILFGGEWPTKWHYEAQDGALQATNIIAPRIQSN